MSLECWSDYALLGFWSGIKAFGSDMIRSCWCSGVLQRLWVSGNHEEEDEVERDVCIEKKSLPEGFGTIHCRRQRRPHRLYCANGLRSHWPVAFSLTSQRHHSCFRTVLLFCPTTSSQTVSLSLWLAFLLADNIPLDVDIMIVSGLFCHVLDDAGQREGWL